MPGTLKVQALVKYVASYFSSFSSSFSLLHRHTSGRRLCEGWWGVAMVGVCWLENKRPMFLGKLVA